MDINPPMDTYGFSEVMYMVKTLLETFSILNLSSLKWRAFL